MHIVYVIAPAGGPEAFVQTIAPWLADQGHRVSVIYTAPALRVHSAFSSTVRVEYAPSGVWHYYLWKIVGDFRALPLRLRAVENSRAVYDALSQIAETDPVDLVEVTEGFPIEMLKRRWRVVVRAHGSDWTFRHFCDEGDGSHDRHLIDLEARQLAQADGVSAISQHLAQHLSEFCHFPLERIQVIPYPIDSQEFQPNIQPRNTNAPVLLSIGRLEKRKGTDAVLKALSQKVWMRVPNLTIYLIGKETGFRQSDLLAMVPESKRAQVIFPGFVEHRRLAEYYQRAMLYAAPTQYETFAYTILEAMACGMPVVASRVGAIPELVDDGATGLLVPPNDPEALSDAILVLLADQARREQMGQRGREKAIAEYGVEKIGARTLEFYHKALSVQSAFA